MKPETIRCLELVENALDPAHLARTRQLWEDCRHYRRFHWCGDGKAWWRSLITLRHLTAVNPYQGQFYDPVEMHRACRDAGVMIWQWTTGLTPQQREVIRTGFTCIQGAGDVEAAKVMYDQWSNS